MIEVFAWRNFPRLQGEKNEGSLFIGHILQLSISLSNPEKRVLESQRILDKNIEILKAVPNPQ